MVCKRSCSFTIKGDDSFTVIQRCAENGTEIHTGHVKVLKNIFCDPWVCTSCLKNADDVLKSVLEGMEDPVFSAFRDNPFTNMLINGDIKKARMIFEKQPCHFFLSIYCNVNNLTAVKTAFEVCGYKVTTYGCGNDSTTNLFSRCVNGCYDEGIQKPNHGEMLDLLQKHWHFFHPQDVLRASYCYSFLDIIKKIMDDPNISPYDKKIDLSCALKGGNADLLAEILDTYPWVGIKKSLHISLHTTLEKTNISVIRLLWEHFPEMDQIMFPRKGRGDLDSVTDTIYRAFVYHNVPLIRFLLERFPDATRSGESVMPHQIKSSKVQETMTFMDTYLPLFLTGGHSQNL